MTINFSSPPLDYKGYNDLEAILVFWYINPASHGQLSYFILTFRSFYNPVCEISINFVVLV